MTSPPETPPAPPPPRNGRRTFLLYFVVLPVLLVPGLLMGPVQERQLCMNTLQTRTARYWAMGLVPLQSREWRIEDYWPARMPYPINGAQSLPPFPTESPEAFYRQQTAWPAGEPLPHIWESVERQIPFAFVFPVTNTRAMNHRSRPVFELRMAMAKSLQSPEDAPLFQQWDSALRDGTSEELVITLSGRQKLTAPDDFPGQTVARSAQPAIQKTFAESVSLAQQSEEQRLLLRKTLTELVSTLDPTNSPPESRTP
jgi:hypothetical protein